MVHSITPGVFLVLQCRLQVEEVFLQGHPRRHEFAVFPSLLIVTLLQGVITLGTGKIRETFQGTFRGTFTPLTLFFFFHLHY